MNRLATALPKINLVLLALLVGMCGMFFAARSQTVIHGSRKFTGSIQTGWQSGKTGFSAWVGATDGGISGFSVPDTAGGPILYLMPTTAGAPTNILAVGSSVTCPTLPSDAPAFTCYQLSWVAH